MEREGGEEQVANLLRGPVEQGALPSCVARLDVEGQAVLLDGGQESGFSLGRHVERWLCVDVWSCVRRYICVCVSRARVVSCKLLYRSAVYFCVGEVVTKIERERARNRVFEQ